MKVSDIRNSSCTACKMHAGTSDVCEMGSGPKKPSIMVVGKFINSKRAQDRLETYLKTVGLDPTKMYFTAAVKCRVWDLNPKATEVKACRTYLDQEIALLKPKWILTMGNEALLATTGHSGIMKWRGHVETRADGVHVFATIAPGAVERNPGQRIGFESDLKFFEGLVMHRESKLKKPDINYVYKTSDFKRLKKSLSLASFMGYDIETSGDTEFHEGAKISSIAFTLEVNNKVEVWAMPLGHINSPFRKIWQGALKNLAPVIEAIPKQIAHNGKFDSRWLRHFGVNTRVTFDTLLACHLLDENRPKGLKPQAVSRLGVAPWGIDTKDLDNTPLEEVLEYNALDTFYMYHIYLQLREELLEKPRLAKIFQHILMPANELLIEAERRGVWVDREKLASHIKIGFDTRDGLEEKLMEWVPPADPEFLDTWGIDWPKQGKKSKLAEVNFNASNFARWWLFDYLKLPIVERTDSGLPSMAEACMLELRGEHPAVDIMLERSKWQKYCSSFLTSYQEMMDEEDRIHTTFKLWGTVTGRLSSGKADAEKVTARQDIRGVNLQQVPRDPFIRGLFGAAPGYTFVEIDFSQVELRVVAFLSRDPTMLRLYQTGQDIHRATAAWVLGVPASKVSSEDRKKAKAVNFGFVYGMGAPKFVSTAFEKYEVVFTLEEARVIRKTFFTQFSGLPSWHAKQRRLVHKYKRVVSPLGRVRNLPDIDSEEDGVVGEAERQAINSPVQGFASDMNLLAMIETVKNLKAAGIRGNTIGTVHDATMFEIKNKDLAKALPIIKDTFENVPVHRFGVEMDVPILGDIKVGTHWGGARELSIEEIYHYKGEE